VAITEISVAGAGEVGRLSVAELEVLKAEADAALAAASVAVAAARSRPDELRERRKAGDTTVDGSMLAGAVAHIELAEQDAAALQERVASLSVRLQAARVDELVDAFLAFEPDSLAGIAGAYSKAQAATQDLMARLGEHNRRLTEVETDTRNIGGSDRVSFETSPGARHPVRVIVADRGVIQPVTADTLVARIVTPLLAAVGNIPLAAARDLPSFPKVAGDRVNEFGQVVDRHGRPVVA
jgi:hypothetical protein